MNFQWLILKHLDLISNFKFQIENYLTMISINLVNVKSNPPKNRPTIRLKSITIIVDLITFSLVGQTTFLSSSLVSLRNATGVVINK
ncbi:MAG: hypothetical protein A3E40_01160 [Candidatus Levybacteria bacterium RIFCSPHIGHO2_12_FULL_37_9]|nr:MAG: hypothetical protein A3E40_01160 [Candidatus Levybacteria bacterium RIFCSPHIGHO2_12_FULL_37_9]